MKPVVLVTAIGTVTATAIVTELKKTNEYYLIGADINPENQIATSLNVDEYQVFPYASNDDYLDFVLDFCKQHKVDYYYAVLDIEVVKISRARDKFAEIGTKLCMANYEYCSTCHFKNSFNEWIRNNVPEVYIKTYQSYDEIKDFPVFIKPVEGVASSGCRPVQTMEALKESVSLEAFNKKIIVQELVKGDVITVDLIRNRKTGQKAQVQRKELLRNGNGCGIAVEIVKYPQLEEICNTLMEKLDLNGVSNAEFFCVEKDGEPVKFRIIEINPRFSAGSRYTCMAGINTVLNAKRIADGEKCEFGTVEVGQHFAERYEAYRMN